MTNPRLFSFAGGSVGEWSVLKSVPVIGDGLPEVPRLQIGNAIADGAAWTLKGVTSNERYVEVSEKAALVAKQKALGRPEARYGAMIPIRKNEKWWSLTQQERREIIETRSRHIEVGLRYLPPIARRLHHCRDLGEPQPFDFITLFDYEKVHVNAFEELVTALRETEEWKYVEREVDLRLYRDR